MSFIADHTSLLLKFCLHFLRAFLIINSSWQNDLEVSMVTEERTRLTVDLPKALVKKADALVRRGAARSRNRLIAQAVEAYLKQLEEAQIDAQFAEMEHDERYRKLSLEIAREFERSDWEALQVSEGADQQ
jgi:Arc/MetJ-type ribon-helix-helix transcriptional regulator